MSFFKKYKDTFIYIYFNNDNSQSVEIGETSKRGRRDHGDSVVLQVSVIAHEHEKKKGFTEKKRK